MKNKTAAHTDDDEDAPKTTRSGIRTTLRVIKRPIVPGDDDEDGDPEEAEKRFEREPMSKELFEALYKGFDGLTIHGDAEKCDKEISLFPLFSALYACINDNISDEDIDKALDFIQDNASLTANANKKWNSQLRRAMKNDKCEGPGALFKYLRTFNPIYYGNTIVPLLPKREPVVEAKFDLKDSFSIKDMRKL